MKTINPTVTELFSALNNHPDVEDVDSNTVGEVYVNGVNVTKAFDDITHGEWTLNAAVEHILEAALSGAPEPDDDYSDFDVDRGRGFLVTW